MPGVVVIPICVRRETEGGRDEPPEARGTRFTGRRTPRMERMPPTMVSRWTLIGTRSHYGGVLSPAVLKLR